MKAKSLVQNSATRTQVNARVDSQVYKVSLAVIGISGCIIGLWAAASLVSGMMVSGGPLELIADWFKAVTTM